MPSMQGQCLCGDIHVFWTVNNNHPYGVFCVSTPPQISLHSFTHFSRIYLLHEHYNQSVYLLHHLWKGNTKGLEYNQSTFSLICRNVQHVPSFLFTKKRNAKIKHFFLHNFPLFISQLRNQIIIAYNWKASSQCLSPSVIIHPCAKIINVAQQNSIYNSFAERKLYSPGYCTLGFSPHNLKLNIINKLQTLQCCPSRLCLHDVRATVYCKNLQTEEMLMQVNLRDLFCRQNISQTHFSEKFVQELTYLGLLQDKIEVLLPNTGLQWPGKY